MPSTRRSALEQLSPLIVARYSKLAMRVRFPSPAPPHLPAETVAPPDHEKGCRRGSCHSRAITRYRDRRPSLAVLLAAVLLADADHVTRRVRAGQFERVRSGFERPTGNLHRTTEGQVGSLVPFIRVRTGRNEGDKADRRQSAAGQIAGLIRDVRPVREIIESMVAEAAALAAALPRLAAARG